MKAMILTLALSPVLAWAGEAIDQSISVPSDGHIYIDNQRGNVVIKGWDKNELKVTGTLDDKAEGFLLENRGSRTDFVVNMPKSYNSNWDDNSEGSKLTIFMPVTSAVNFEGVSVDVKISELRSDARIGTVNGDIDAKQLVGNITLETVNGSIDALNLGGELRYQTVNGDIEDVDSQGQLMMTLVNGDVRSNTKAEDIRFENVNGDLTLRVNTLGKLSASTVNGELEVYVNELTKEAQIRAESVSGDFDLYLPMNISARFDIEAHAGGDISNALSSDKPLQAKYGPGESLHFNLGQGEAEVDITTISGDISLYKLKQ